MASVQGKGVGAGNFINSFVSFLKGSSDSNMGAESEKVTKSETNSNRTKSGNAASKRGNEDSKDGDDSNLSTNSKNGNDTSFQRKKRRISTESTDSSELPQRRTRRSVKRYTVDEDGEENVEDSKNKDPDYDFSDSDDDPDFNPSSKKGSQQASLDTSSNKGKICRRRSNKGSSIGSGKVADKKEDSVSSSVNDDSNHSSSNNGSNGHSNDSNNSNSGNSDSASKRRGRPPMYLSSQTPKSSDTPQNEKAISDDAVSSSSDDPTIVNNNNKLSSAYNFCSTRIRQNQAIRLPEGPNLTEEQVKIIESQFQSGDFVMCKKDTEMDNPPIWRIDGKSLLQKFQAFEKDGKTLYRNISTYSGWTTQAKALYVGVKVNFVFQSRYDIVVELLGFKDVDGNADDNSAELLSDKQIMSSKVKEIEVANLMKIHMPSFEIYLQTLISQALDNNFLQEIYEENDTYFVERLSIIDSLINEKREKLMKLSKWNENFQSSLDAWPCVNAMSNKSHSKCGACGVEKSVRLSQFYGQPYNAKTLRSKEPTTFELDNKNWETCDQCSMYCQLYNKVAHQKYDFYSQCKSAVTNMRVAQPNKSTTNVLRDLLANDSWISGLFRTMCTSWAKVDSICEEHREKLERNEEGKNSEKKADEDDVSANEGNGEKEEKDGNEELKPADNGDKEDNREIEEEEEESTVEGPIANRSEKKE